MTERIFRYVVHSKRAAYEACGWLISELGPPHCDYSVLAEWVGDGEPVEPPDSISRRQSEKAE